MKSDLIKANPPTVREKLTLRLLIISGLISMGVFIYWFIENTSPGHMLLFIPLIFALAFKLLRMLHEWYHYLNISVPEKPEKISKKLTVDMFTTACPGEPKKMIINTLKAMVAVKYPHTSYLCDEGNDPELKQACNELGVIHVTRTVKVDAKAGNINNALKQAKGDLCIILDPDHAPFPEFIDRVLPYFEDSKLAYVQVVQAYGNQSESLIARAAGEQSYSFYGPIMMGMNNCGTAQAIGANCTFRRTALDSIGGHAAGLTEDMHTSMLLHSKGWKSVYVPEILSRGYVPSTLPAYYKQQLKWSRGTFDLFFKVFPRIVKKISWSQKIHYFTLPMYFSYGLINLIDLLIPIFALFMCEVPFETNIARFALMFLPLLIFSQLIRQFSQRWLLEKHERGFHLLGGILRIGTWWILLLGLVYTLLRIKVPYIPTPKDDEPQNNLKLCLPNFIIGLVSIAAVIYGYSVDSSPYTAFMGGFALLNAFILFTCTIMGQEKLIKEASIKIKESFIYKPFLFPVIQIIYAIRHLVYNTLRKGTLIIAVISISAFYGFTKIEDINPVDLKTIEHQDIGNTGGFYTGVYIPSLDKEFNIKPVENFEKNLNAQMDIISFYLPWGHESLNNFPEKMLKEISRKGSVAMITWEPWSSDFPEFKNHPQLSTNKKICEHIAAGTFDNYLHDFSSKIKDYGEPVFLRFAHEPDNQFYPWSQSGGNSPEEYRKAWKYVVEFFEKVGVSNVSWVWNPMSYTGIDDYFPGRSLIDWIGITSLNYGRAGSDGKWYSFEELYEPYREKLLEIKRPVMLAEFGSTNYGGSRERWVGNALKSIKEEYTEIKSVVFFNSNQDNNWITEWRPSIHTNHIDWRINKSLNEIKMVLNEMPFNEKPFKRAPAYSEKLTFKMPDKNYKSKFIKGQSGSFEFIHNNQPFYITGIAYNPGHDWRDGNLPLTRRQVAKDFKKIKEMGANTIRRYSPGYYDGNIFKEAKAHDLKILYGFWFDPEVDYYKDTARVLEYIKEVEETVLKYKDNPSIIAWGIGNETWGILKHNFSKPYLVKVRNQYVKFIEHLSQLIHSIDSNRPVFTTAEHSVNQLPGEIFTFHQNAPSIDIFSVNSFYEEQLSMLQELTHKFDSTRPYLVAEFGPKGYWLTGYNQYKGKRVKEDSDYQKAKLYVKEWNKYVLGNKGNNIGGVAYCWRDRMEGSYTWYGLTDVKGRKKPTYYALKSDWTGEKINLPITDFTIESSDSIFTPGKEYIFKAKGSYEENLTFEWNLQKEEYLGEINEISLSDNGRTAMVTIPLEPSNYRLYLFVSDKNGNVVCASEPLNLEEN